MKKAAKEKANVVGIFGMGGVGKTTLSKELFNRKRSKYTRASFLFDVREACASGKLPKLQRQLLKDLFSEDHHSFQSSEEGTSYLRDRLERSNSFNFLIVLDDIDHVEQLDALLDMDILNKSAQSGNYLVIITTRDVGVLVSARIDKGYHLKGLDREDGRELFCWHAFGRPQPCSGFEDLVQAFVNLCGGLPLSLQVLGRHVSGRARWYWQGELKKVSKTLPGDIKQRLKISFDTLDDVEKKIFLDIACFFIDKTISKAMSIWETSGWSAHHALETLKEKCLVEVQVGVFSSEWYVFRMHDHLRDLGREIANEQSHARRVWQPQHLKSLELKGFQYILAQTKGRCFHSILDKSMGCGITYFLGEPEDGSDTSLLWLQLEYMSCPALDLNSDINSSIPSWISLQNLRCLRINNGRFQKLWQSDVQAPSHLKELQIHDTYLEEFPYLSGKLSQMEKLVLHAKDMQMDIWHLLGCLPRMNLLSLNVMGSEITGDLASNDTAEGTTFMPFVISDCKQLWEGVVALNDEAWSRTVMGDVENLEIKGQRLVTKILITGNCCQRLQSLKICEMDNLIEVDLARINTLNCLEITGCENFKRLSVTPDLSKLVELKIKGCTELEELPSLSRLSCLEQIEIDSCEKLKFEYLCLSRMKCLERITFDGNVKVKYIELDGCPNLKTIRFSFEELVELSIRGCPELQKLPLLSDLSCLERILVDGCEKLKYLVLDGCQNLKSVSGNLFRELNIYECPELEKLQLARWSCLEEIRIDSCEKLQNIMVPTTLLELSVRRCTDLRSVAGTGDLTKLKRLIFRECPKLEKLPSLSTLSCLERIEIDSCEKLKFEYLCLSRMKCLERITFDRNVKVKCFELDGCPNLKTIKFSCEELVELSIRGCPELKKLPVFRGLSCLERILIDGCEKLEYLSLDGCQNLKSVSGNLFRQLYITGCPELEEVHPARLSCLEEIAIDSCEKLQNITVPTLRSVLLEIGCLESLWRRSCLESLWRRSCLPSVAGIGDFTNLTRLIIKQCPEHEELPSLATLSCLKEITIDSCEKLQNITLPTTLLSLSVRRCRNLQSVGGIGDFTNLTRLNIKQCPRLEELSSLVRLSWMEKLQNISELRQSEYMKLCYCRNAVILNCIHKLKSMPSEYTFVSGRAVDGAELALNEHLFSEVDIGADAVTEISPLFSDGFQMRTSELSFVIGCFVVMVDSSSLVEDISKTLPRYHDGYVVSLPKYVCPGKWIITMVACDDRSYHWYYKNGEDVLRRHGIMKGFRIEVKKGEEGKRVGVLRTIVDRLHCSCWEFVSNVDN